jgi:hypothetical protein
MLVVKEQIREKEIMCDVRKQIEVNIGILGNGMLFFWMKV